MEITQKLVDQDLLLLVMYLYALSYFLAIPSEVTLLCNNMPCGETVAVGDIVTCVAHGYPQPVFDLRTRDLSVKAGATTESRGLEDDNTEESIEVEIKGSESIQIGPQDVGHMEITCNVSNALGWGYNSLDLEVTPSKSFRDCETILYYVTA